MLISRISQPRDIILELLKKRNLNLSKRLQYPENVFKANGSMQDNEVKSRNKINVHHSFRRFKDAGGTLTFITGIIKEEVISKKYVRGLALYLWKACGA